MKGDKASMVRVVTLTEVELEAMLERAAQAAASRVAAPEVLTAAEAGELLRLAEQTVARMAKAGEIPCQRLGREWRFRRSVLLEWLGRKVA